jgi:hypothetical protein
MMKRLPWVLFLLAATCGLAADDLLEGLRPGHPRLLATSSAWSELRERRQHDAALNEFLHRLEKEGRETLKLGPLRYEKQGRRLLAVSRSAVRRIWLLAFDYRMTGDPAFKKRAQEEMLTAAAFKDWNPSHYLDTAEMTAALAAGYDWLYDDLAPDARKLIRQAIVEKGLRTGCDPKLPNTGWYKGEMNWNQVCFGGLTLGALAVAEDEPELARQMLAQAKAYNPYGLKPYAPEGVYPEGPNYWGYGTSYQVVMLAALESALGTDWGLTTSPGFLDSLKFVAEVTGPTGLSFNFSDAGHGGVGIQPAAYWMARRLNDPSVLYWPNHLLQQELAAPRKAEMLGGERFAPLLAFWWPDLGKPQPPDLPLNWCGRGPNPIAVFRESWTNTNSLYLAVKGGSASLSHAHMDAGSFVFDVDGIRWARDLGAQDYYSLESKKVDLWNRAQNSDRWKVFRISDLSHNTLTINGQLHEVKGRAEIVKFNPQSASPLAILDLSEVFQGQAAQVRRGFRVLPDRAVLVQDELTGLKAGDEVRWAMLTTARVKPAGRSASLHLDGRSLQAQLLGVNDAKFEVISAECAGDPINARNPDTRILIAKIKAPTDGKVRFGVRLVPGGGTAAPPPELVPLDDWR